MKIKKFKLWIYARTPIQKQSKQVSIYSENNGSYIKVSLIVWFHILYNHCELNGYVYILQIVLDTLDKLMHDSQNICGCLTLNAMHIKLASLIIWSINGILINKSLTYLPQVKKTVLYIVHIIILCISTVTFIYWKLNDKTLNFFKRKINITVVLLSCGVFKCN